MSHRRGSKAKTAQTVFTEAKVLSERYGVNRLLFLTLTFPDQVKSITEAQRRWNSLNTGVFKVHFERAIVVFERTPGRGLVHLHCLAVPRSDADYRTGFDWDAYFQGKAGSKAARYRCYRSAIPELRAFWSLWRSVSKRYGFGICEILPVRTSALQCARYVASYLTKAQSDRLPEDQGRRLLRFVGYRGKRRASGSWESLRTITTNSWAWATQGARWSRVRLKWAATQSGLTDPDHARRVLGKRWAYKLAHLGREIPRWAVPDEFVERWKVDRQRLALKASQALTAATCNAEKKI